MLGYYFTNWYKEVFDVKLSCMKVQSDFCGFFFLLFYEIPYLYSYLQQVGLISSIDFEIVHSKFIFLKDYILHMNLNVLRYMSPIK